MSTGVFVTPHQNDDQGEARDGCDGGRKRCAHSRQSCEDDQAAAEAALLDPDRQGVPIIEVEQHPEIRNREARDAQQGVNRSRRRSIAGSAEYQTRASTGDASTAFIALAQTMALRVGGRLACAPLSATAFAVAGSRPRPSWR